jgi:hypothetical protein
MNCTVKAIFLAALLLPLAAQGTERSHAARAEFQREHPCPANGERRGPCPGYVVDHVQPLACGGADAPVNMQWQSRAQAKAKDRWERRGCRHRNRRQATATSPVEPTMASLQLANPR